MLLRLGDQQKVPGLGVFEWDGSQFWVFGDIKKTHSELYVMLKDMNMVFNVISIWKESK